MLTRLVSAVAQRAGIAAAAAGMARRGDEVVAGGVRIAVV